jgi:predicted transcriptional regulator
MSKILSLQPEIPDEMAERVREIAKRTGRTLSELTADALEAYVVSEPEFRRLVEEGRADIAAGRLVDHETVRADRESRRHS